MDKMMELVSDARRIGIGGHVRPDGDCVGSTLALYGYLKDAFPDREVDLYLEEIPEAFRFLARSDEAKGKEAEDRKGKPPYDLFFSLDCGDDGRLGFAAPLFHAAGRTVCIDHHVSNAGFATENLIEPEASSTCEILYGLLDEGRITRPIAEALYLGIVHDTGVFKYSCTSGRTMAIAGRLMEKGIPFPRIIDETFFEKTYVQNQILGRCLLESFLMMDGKVIAACLPKSVLDFYGATSGDLDGVVDQLRVTRGVEVVIFAYETDTQEYKVSLRSNGKADVSAVAQYFGGGGHVCAAGCTMKGSYHDVINNLTGQIAEQLSVREGAEGQEEEDAGSQEEGALPKGRDERSDAGGQESAGDPRGGMRQKGMDGGALPKGRDERSDARGQEGAGQ